MTALVTGATSGIGRAIAVALAAEGAPVWAVGRRPEALDALTAACPSIRGERADLVVDDDVERLVSTLTTEAGGLDGLDGLDVLVHAAGTAVLGCVAAAPIDALDHMYRLNLRVPYLLTQRLLPLLRRARGQVVFVNSSAGLHASAGASQYAATKHALKALADSLRCEANDDGVRVWMTPGHGEDLSIRIAKLIRRARKRVRLCSPVITTGPVLGTLAQVIDDRSVDLAGCVDATQVREVVNQWRENQNVSWKLPLLRHVMAGPFGCP